MEGSSFVYSGQYASDLIEKSMHHSGKAPNLNRYPSALYTRCTTDRATAPATTSPPTRPTNLDVSRTAFNVLHAAPDEPNAALARGRHDKDMFKSVAEFLGTLMLCTFGLGVSNQVAETTERGAGTAHNCEA